jgi:GNAT superfamily N-acetyltransferase
MTKIDDGHWLTGLLVAPRQRYQGLARRLVAQVLYEAMGLSGCSAIQS